MLNMFRTLIFPSSGACDYSVELPYWSYCSWFDVCWSFVVVGLEWYPCGSCASACHTDTTPIQPHWNSNTHQNKNHDQCGDTIETLQAPDDGCINVRNMLSIGEVKQNLINCDIKLVSYSSRSWWFAARQCMTLLQQASLRGTKGWVIRLGLGMESVVSTVEDEGTSQT